MRGLGGIWRGCWTTRWLGAGGTRQRRRVYGMARCRQGAWARNLKPPRCSVSCAQSSIESRPAVCNAQWRWGRGAVPRPARHGSATLTELTEPRRGFGLVRERKAQMGRREFRVTVMRRPVMRPRGDVTCNTCAREGGNRKRALQEYTAQHHR